MYLMMSAGWTLDKALDAVVAVRPTQCVNDGFMAQLQALDVAGCDVEAAKELLTKDERGYWALAEGVVPKSRLPSHDAASFFRRAETT